jgi:hypothetical protein
VVPLWCLFVEADVSHDRLAPLVAMRAYREQPDVVLFAKRMFVRCVGRLLDERESGAGPWWLAWFYFVFRSVPDDWMPRLRDAGARHRAERLMLALHANHFGVARPTAWSQVQRIDARDAAECGWPWRWMLDLLPTAWGPRCAAHALQPERVLVRLDHDGAPGPDGDAAIRPSPEGGRVTVVAVACPSEACACMFALAEAHARARWPALWDGAERLLRGESVRVHPGDWPSDSDAAAYLPAERAVGHASHPALAVLCRVLRIFSDPHHGDGDSEA